MKIGLIAEDYSDIGVLKELAAKKLRPHKVGFKRFIGKGCGKLRRKCRVWAQNLIRQGCSWVVLAHDLGDCEEKKMRRELEQDISVVSEKARVVLIPVREIESWLLHDPNALVKAFKGRKKPKLPGLPESLSDPKKELEVIIRKNFDKEYLNTVHNVIIAKHIDLNRLHKATSYLPYPFFLETVKKQLP